MVARFFYGVAVAGLLAGTACSGGGIAPPAPGSQPALPMPAGVDPASVKPAPMVLTPVQSASAMDALRPQTPVVPPFWVQIPGTVSEVQAAADGSVWALSDQPAGADKYIWHYQNAAWHNVSGLAAHIAAAPDGTLYAVNAGGGLYVYNGTSWTALGGGATAVAAVADNSIYAIEAGPGADGTIWHRVAGTWSQVPGLGVALTGGLDTSTHVIPTGTLAPGGVYVRNSSGLIYYLNADRSYASVPGSGVSVASTPGGTIALGDPSGGSHPLFYYDLDTPGWSMLTGNGAQLSSNAGNLYVVSTTHALYQTSLTTPVNPLNVSVPSLDLVGSGASFAQTYHVTEAGYSGALSESDTCSGIATLAPPSGGNGPDLAVTATGVAAGTCTATYADTHTQTVTITIHVTIGNITVT